MAEMNKIPCIKCTPELWEYIKLYLIEWNYSIYGVDSYKFKTRKILVINRFGKLGDCSNYETSAELTYNRELITNAEEFLEKAATLKGFIYKRKDIMEINGVEIKPGMVIEIQDNDIKLSYVVFPLLNKKLGLICHNKSSWGSIERFIKRYSSKIICIYDLTSEELGGLNRGKVLWEKPKEAVLTMDEIAEKFGIPVEQLRIKDVSGKYKCDFKKEFFKPGMIVEVHNGVSKTYCMVVPTICSGLCISGEHDWEPLFDFDDNLMRGSLEITKVYGLCKINRDSHKICIDNRDLLWSKPVEYTLADIAYRLDIPVEALKIKN